tara:strand:+ start:8517 stop:10691 length:2175 start_codon:yes stop_codon:yes gene_type:complete
MALSPGFSYDSTIDEHYIVEISNSSSGFIRLSTKEFGNTSSTGYHGYIINKPIIRESIDLSSSTSQISNVTLTCQNNTINNISGTPKLSEEIFGGSAFYINRDVTIKSRLDSTNDLLIYTGRLKSVSMINDETVTLEITAKTPIDFLKIPQNTSKSGKFFPILYGNATPVDSTVSSPVFVQYSNVRVFPLEVDTLNNSQYNCLAHKEISGGSADGRLHFPIKDLFHSTDNYPIFVNLDDKNNSTVNVYEGITDTNKNILQTDLDLERSYKYRPVQKITKALPDVGLPANQDNFFDNNDTTSSTWAVNLPQGNKTTTFTYTIEDIAKEQHELQEYKLFVKWGVTNYDETPGATLNARLQVSITYGGLTNTRTINTVSSNRTAAYESAIDLLNTSLFSNANGQVPDKIQIKFQVIGALDPGDQDESAGSLTMNLADFHLLVKSKISDTDVLANSSAIDRIKKLYTGADGLDQSFNTGNIVTNIAQMHRDLIHRFAGITTTPENFSTLNSARSNWSVYYYLNEQETLQEILENCQKEGGFIFRFKASDSSPQYIFIQNTESTDHTLTKDDIKNSKVSITQFDNLITKRIIKYDRNPINDEYINEKTFTDTTNNPRSNFNVQSNENELSEELDILVDSIGSGNLNMGSGNRNDGYANYYNSIQGLPKILIETEIVNPSFYVIEVGDIVAINHNNQISAPFGQSFNGKQFFVTSITRSIGNMKIKLREI